MRTEKFKALSLRAAVLAVLGSSISPAFAQDSMLPEVLRPIRQQEVMEVINPDDFKDNLGNHIAEQTLQMGGNDITGVGSLGGSSFSFSSGQTSGIFTAGSVVSSNINANNGRITRADDPVSPTDVVNLRTMQAAINAGRDNLGNHIATRILITDGNPIHTGSISGVDGSGNVTLTGGMIINNQTISGLVVPVGGSDAANKAYVDAVRTDVDMSTIVRTVGNQSIDGSKTFVRQIGASSGLNSGNAKIVNLADATDGQDAVNLRVMQSAIANGGDNLGNHKATQVLDMSGFRTINVATPTAGTDAVNRDYLFAIFSGRRISTGVGLIGGGDLSTDRTFQLADNYIRRSAATDSLGVLAYNGFSPAAGQFHGGSSDPTGATRINYNGNLYASRMWSSAYFYFSDRNLKKNIETIEQNDGMEAVMKLRPVSYEWKADGKEALGVIAQEVQEVLPTAVVENEGGTLAVDYIQMIAPMIAAMQQMEGRIQDLEAQLAEHQN